jgi:hypothetical protein
VLADGRVYKFANAFSYFQGIRNSTVVTTVCKRHKKKKIQIVFLFMYQKQYISLIDIVVP